LEGFILPVFKKNVRLMHTFLPQGGRVSRESPGTPEHQARAGLAVLKALTIVAQGGGPNKGLHLTAFSLRSCVAAASGTRRSLAFGAFHLINLYTNAIDHCFTWRYSSAHTMEDDALWQ
jgi:hypothetical protein